MRYENSQVFIAVEWDDPSGELNVYLGPRPRKGQRAAALSLNDALRMEEASARRMPFQVSDENRLEPFLEELATELRTHAARHWMVTECAFGVWKRSELDNRRRT